MSFLSPAEKKISSNFIRKGYVIQPVEKKISLSYIDSLIKNSIKKILKIKKNINLDLLHEYVTVSELNKFRLNLIRLINKDKNFRKHYFNLARNSLFELVSNELMMQKNINLSIQFPNDKSSLLPIHSDVWSGDSPYEINLWVPLVDCYRTKSMYILSPKENDKFNKHNKIFKNSSQIYDFLKNKLKWISIKKGQILIFNQCLPHGNVVNKENHTRISMNCRFKSVFSPYGDKKIGEFFSPITTRAMTEIAINYNSPFKNIDDEKS